MNPAPYVAEDCFNLTLMGREALGSVEYWWPIVNIHFVLPSSKTVKKPLIIDFWNSQCRIVSYSLRISSIKFLPLVELASNYTFLISLLLYYSMILFTISCVLFMIARLMLYNTKDLQHNGFDRSETGCQFLISNSKT